MFDKAIKRKLCLWCFCLLKVSIHLMFSSMCIKGGFRETGLQLQVYMQISSLKEMTMILEHEQSHEVIVRRHPVDI